MSKGYVVGTDAKADCRVSVAAAGATTIDVRTKGAELVERGIRQVVEAALDAAGVSELSVTVEDFGSVDVILVSRLEAALRLASAGSSIPVTVHPSRTPSEKDQPRRSRLYAPGNNPRVLAGIEIHGADCVLLDLEDSVPLTQKAHARILVKRLLAATRFPEEVWVRINALSCGGRDDLAEVLQGHPHGICLPKAERAEDVCELAGELTRLEGELGIPVGSTWIMPIVETAAGVLGCEAVAAADERVAIVAFGAEDYTRDVGCARTDAALLFARSRLVAATAVAGVQVSDTVFADVADDEGLYAESCTARSLGFDGKGAINPRQLGPIHRAFSPTPDEVDQARAVVAAADEAEAAGLGVVSLDGKMVDRPVVERARRVLRTAERLSARRVK